MPFDYTGSFSGSFTGDLTSTNGVISASAQVNYSQIQNKPTTITAFQSNQIVANSYFRENTYLTASGSLSTRLTSAEGRLTTLEAAIDDTGSDTQTLSLAGYNLSISNGNTVSLAGIAGGGGVGGSSIWTTGSQDPSSFTYRETSNNLQVTGSLRVSGGITGSLLGTAETASYIDPTFISASAAASGFGDSGTDLTPLNTFTGSIQTEVDSLTAATSSYLTEAPAGTISGSQQITDLGFISSSHTDISSLNTFTGSIQTEVDLLTSATSSYVTNNDTASMSVLTSETASYALYAVSASHEITYETSASHAENADTASYIDPTFISASVVDAGFGGSVSSFPYTGSAVISGSLQITGSLDLLHTGVDALRIQGDDGIEIVGHTNGVGGGLAGTQGGHIYPKAFSQLLNRDGSYVNPGPLNNGGHQAFAISGYNTGTSLALQTPNDGYVLFASGGINQTWMGYGTSAEGKLWVRDYLNVEGQISASGGITGSLMGTADTASYIDPSFISASAAASGFSSGGAATDISALNTFTGSIQSEVDNLTAATSSYLTAADTSSFLTELPSGVVSGSDQITDVITDSYISASVAASGFGEGLHTDITSLNSFTGSIQSEVDGLTAATSSYLTSLPNGVISSSAQITITESQISDLVHTDISGLNTFTGSIQSEVNSLTNVTASYITNDDTASMSVLNSVTASYIEQNFISASAAAAGFGSEPTDVSSLNAFTSSIQGEVTSLVNATSSYLVTTDTASMVVLTADTASYVQNAVSASYATYALSASYEISYETSASHSETADTASYVDPTFISASAVASGFGAGGNITYVSESGDLSLTEIEVADFDNNVAVTFVNGRLKFTFGTPTSPSSLSTSLSGFATDRFNQVTDAYNVNGSWSNGGYTLITASLWEGSTKLTEVTSGTSLSYSTTTSGSHTYTIQYTASSPLDGSEYKTTASATGTISKSNPASPTISSTPDVQLGYSSNQIEQGATGSITFTSSSSATSNSWLLDYTSTSVSSPIYVTGSATGSSSISFNATANYYSPLGDNNPNLTTTTSATTTYTKIRSVRYGASTATSFTQTELEDLGAWDTTLGGSIGTIIKGDTTPSGNTITITWSGDKYHYIVFDASRSNLTNITTNGFGVLGSFTVSTVGNYKVYKSNTLQAGGSGNSITYILT